VIKGKFALITTWSNYKKYWSKRCY
jgi:hypothetical protein